MALKLSDLKLEVSLPQIPRSVGLYDLKAPSLEERKAALDLLTRKFELGDTRLAELPDCVVRASQRGEVQYFPASGAIIGRDAAPAAAFKTEERPWPNLQRVKEGAETNFVLEKGQAAKLLQQARALIDEAGLTTPQLKTASVALDQVAQLDAKGKVLKTAAGTATVKHGYEVDGIRVAGAGAKTLIFAEPQGADARISGLLHVWRPVGAARTLALPKVEDALAAGLLVDRELSLLQKRGQRIRITRLEFCYMALPAFRKQGILYPVFQVEGAAAAPAATPNGQEILFAKYVQAAASSAYESVGVFAHYLQDAGRERSASVAV